MSPTTTDRRPGLSRERILDAALALVDRDGLDELSMRRLAAELDVEAMSLYRHVDNKDDLLAGLTDVVWSEIAGEAPPDPDWPGWLRSLGGAVRNAVLRHPNAVAVLVSGDVSPPSALLLFADQLDHVDGVDRDRAVSALRTVAAFALGCVVSELSCFGPGPTTADETDRQRLARISRALPQDTPDRLVDVALTVCGDCDTQRMFTEGLELIVRGCQLDGPPPQR